jgi:hypothetical protein
MKLRAIALAMFSFFATLPAPLFVCTPVICMTGCTVSAQQIRDSGAVVGNMLINMAAAVQNETEAARLVAAGEALIKATANFQLGSATAIINDSINAAMVILSALPQTAAIAPLLPIVEAAIDILLANIHPNGNKIMVKTSTVKLATIHHRVGRSQAGDFKAAFNSTLKANPKLALVQPIS